MRVLVLLLFAGAVAAAPQSTLPPLVAKGTAKAPCAACGVACKCSPNCGCDYHEANKYTAPTPTTYYVPYRVPARSVPQSPFPSTPGTTARTAAAPSTLWSGSFPRGSMYIGAPPAVWLGGTGNGCTTSG